MEASVAAKSGDLRGAGSEGASPSPRSYRIAWRASYALSRAPYDVAREGSGSADYKIFGLVESTKDPHLGEYASRK